MTYLRRYSPTKLCDCAQMANFWRFWGPVFPASSMQHISDLHSKLTLGPEHVSKCGRSNLRPLRLGEEKKKELECGPMPNVMVALPNIGGALCSTPQSLADAHY